MSSPFTSTFSDGRFTITFDRPDSTANIFDPATLQALEELVDSVTRLPSATSLVFRTAKDSIFVAGADLNVLENASPEDLELFLIQGQRVFQKIAGLSCITVAEIHGACLGGGCELALACDWRVASDDRSTKIGLPETQLGILPGWGGSSRLPRLIGLPAALDLILGGKQLAGRQAKKLGLVDGVAARERLGTLTDQLLAKGKPRRPSHWLTNNPLSALVIRRVAGGKARARSRGNYPAIDAALQVVTQAVSGSLTDSMTRERTAVRSLATSPEARQLLRVFHLQERARKFHFSPDPVTPNTVSRVAVIGAGVMGSGIAQWLAARKIPVLLRDLDPARVGAGLRSVRQLFRDAVKHRIFTETEAHRLSGNVIPSATVVPMQSIDLVIEAAVEDLEIKRKIFRDLAGRTRADTLLATNTSALPVSQLAEDPEIGRRDRLIGLHFFNPVARMQLVEIVTTPHTSPEVVETALAFVRKLGKLPVVVGDRPGFLVNRILMPYLIEAGRLFDAGWDAKLIDEAMLDFGMPMGPLRLLDEVGLDVALHVAHTMQSAFGDRFAIPQILDRLVQNGFFGRKTGEGIYEHRKSKGKAVSDNALVRRAHGTAPASLPDKAAVAERLALLMVNEATRCLEEEVAHSEDDVDFAMIFGTGFAPFRGGPIAWAKALGWPVVREKLEALAAREGEAFTPSEWIRSQPG